MTTKIFYEDSHAKQFTAQVLSCEPVKQGFAVILDQTAFYPEGGGQPGDRGTLGGTAVLDTVEKDGELLHICDAPLKEGSQVEGVLDWQRRFSFMQSHSGEHILSGFLHALKGCDNVGFHMGTDTVTIDFNTPITPEELAQAEAQANRYIWENHPVLTSFPEDSVLSQLPYRSKKALTGAVRIVEFPGADICACCGTHVAYTGEIGMVKILSCQKFHEGVRLEMVAGEQAFYYLSRTWEQNRTVSTLLSAKPMETAQAVERMAKELADTKYRLDKLEEATFAAKAAAYEGKGSVVLFESAMTPDALRKLTDLVMKSCGGRAAVFSEKEGGFRYAMGVQNGDLRQLTKDLNAALGGAGGGKPGFTQGSVTADRSAIEAFFEKAD